jgi:hypothetical protein
MGKIIRKLKIKSFYRGEIKSSNKILVCMGSNFIDESLARILIGLLQGNSGGWEMVVKGIWGELKAGEELC